MRQTGNYGLGFSPEEVACGSARAPEARRGRPRLSRDMTRAARAAGRPGTRTGQARDSGTQQTTNRLNMSLSTIESEGVLLL